MDVINLEKELFVTKEDVRNLLRWRSESGILSLYVCFEKGESEATNKWKSKIRSQLSRLANIYPKDKNLESVIEKVLLEIHNLPVELRKRSLVYIRNSGTGEVFIRNMQMPIRDQAFWQEIPHIRPLIAINDLFPVMGIIIPSRDKTKLLTWNQGVINWNEEKTIDMDFRYIDYDPPSVTVPYFFGGSSKDEYTTTKDEEIRKTVDSITSEINRLAIESKWGALLFIGDQKITDLFEKYLPKGWRDKTIGAIHRNFGKSPHNVISESIIDYLTKWIEKEQKSLVEILIKTSKSWGRAITGAQDVLDALLEKKVQHLVFPTDLDITGYKDDSGMLYIEVTDEQAERMKQVPFMIEEMIRLAYENSARITPVEGETADRLNCYGQIGAILRY